MKNINVLRRPILSSMRFAALLFCLFILTARAGAQDFQMWNKVDFTASRRNVDFLAPCWPA